MSRYSELCNAFERDYNNFNNYRILSRDIVLNFCESFVAYIDTSIENLKYVNEEEELMPHFNFEIVTHEDSFSSVKFALKLIIDEKTVYPQEYIAFDIFFKVNNGVLIIYFLALPQHMELPIDKNNNINFTPFNEALFNQIKNFYQQRFDNFIQFKNKQPEGFHIYISEDLANSSENEDLI